MSINGRLLIDGGWVDKIPVLPAFKMGADVVIAVDISAGVAETRKYRRGVDIMVRANTIKDSTLVGYLRRLADVVITPDTKQVHWADFGAYERCISSGDEAVTAKIGEIRDLLRHERLFSFVRTGAHRKLAEMHLQSNSMDVE